MASNSNSTAIGLNYSLAISFVETETSTEDNTSTISCTGSLTAQGSYWTSSYISTLSVYWHDDRENMDRLVASTTFAGLSSDQDSKSATGEITVTHKENGSLNGYAWVYFEKGQTTSMYAPPTSYILTSWTPLTNIDRYPMIVSAPNFSDEDDPTITFTTNLGFQNATVSACISLTGSLDDIPYRQVNVSDGSYTFHLTTAERNTLRNATPNSNVLNVKFFVKTTANGTNYYSNVTRQMTIVNAYPTISTSSTETNQKVISVLGGSGASTVIQNASVLSVTVTPTALKGASISSIRVDSGSYNSTKTSSPYTFSVPVTTNSYSVTAIDSRTNKKTASYSKTLITYLPVALMSCSFERENSTSSNIILNLEATYYQTTFGSTANVPTVKWKLDDGSYTTIPSSNYSIDTTNHKITITDYELTNALVYTSKGTFGIEVSDLLTSSSDSQVVLKGIPTFDYGEHDLKVNGDLYVADQDGENEVDILDTLLGLKGQVLWSNQNPYNSFTAQEIILASDDYDMLEILATSWNTTGYKKIVSVKTKKGLSCILNTQFVNGNDIIFGNRVIDYNTDTSLLVRICQASASSSISVVITNNDVLIPYCIIGYKTGLF